MGIRIHSESEDVGRLTQRVDQVRRHLEQTIAQLSEVTRRIPEPDAVRRARSPTGLESRHDLSNACTSLELALADTLKWATKVAAATATHADRGPGFREVLGSHSTPPEAPTPGHVRLGSP